MGHSKYVLVGGQNGTWFVDGQWPRLERVDLDNYSVMTLTPVASVGTVWGGGWNGSQWLISGWGTDDDSTGPYIFTYDGAHVLAEHSLDHYGNASSWSGGDVFAASYNGKEWLLSGLGSGNLTSYHNEDSINHMALSIFNGNNFTDLSASVPNQLDQILYTNAWNGHYWLVGGGYMDLGVLFSFDGTRIVDLTDRIAQAVPDFGSVQALAWNGDYWLIGGENFLAAYDGYKFTDLTNRLYLAFGSNGCCTSVNAIAWNGAEWMIGGGTPVAQTDYSRAWLVSYSSMKFVNLTPKINPAAAEFIPNSSILTITAAPNSWIIGGYLNGKGLLYEYYGGSFTNLSHLVSSFTYVNWVGAVAAQSHVQTLPPTHNHAFPESRMSRSQYKDWVADTLSSNEDYRFNSNSKS